MNHILLVGKDTDQIDQFRDVLMKRYQISFAQSCHSMLEQIKQQSIEFLLVTWELYCEDDYFLGNVLNQMKEEHHLSYLVLYNKHDQVDIEALYSYGAKDFIDLDGSQTLAFHRIDNHLELQHCQKEYRNRGHLQDTVSVIFAEMVEFRDEATGGHCRNTTRYFKIFLDAVAQDEKYKGFISEEDRIDLIRSAPLHDIGKLGINDDVLRKTSPLDYQEYEHMKTHTIIGRDAFDSIMEETGELRWLQLAKEIAYYHHERWDGTGYPNRLKGEDIPLSARILMIVDVYDALTSRRSYKEPYSHSTAMDIIEEGRGSSFDPNLVDIFISLNDSIEQALKQKQSS